jgi:hypothetical protein
MAANGTASFLIPVNTATLWNDVAVIRLRNDNTAAQWNDVAVVMLRNDNTAAQWNDVAVTCHTQFRT